MNTALLAVIAAAAAVVMFSAAVLRAVAKGYKITAVSLSFTPPAKPKPPEAEPPVAAPAQLREAS